MEVVYEDNHLIIVNKACGEIVQGELKKRNQRNWSALKK